MWRVKRKILWKQKQFHLWKALILLLSMYFPGLWEGSLHKPGSYSTSPPHLGCSSCGWEKAFPWSSVHPCTCVHPAALPAEPGFPFPYLDCTSCSNKNLKHEVCWYTHKTVISCNWIIAIKLLLCTSISSSLFWLVTNQVQFQVGGEITCCGWWQRRIMMLLMQPYPAALFLRY